MNRNLHIFFRSHEPQHQAHQNREPSPRGVKHDGRREEPVFLAPSFEFAAACREDVLHPLRVAAIGQSDDEPSRNSKHIYGCAVDLPRFAAHVSENAEAG